MTHNSSEYPVGESGPEVSKNTVKPDSENSESNPEFEGLLLEATKTKEQERLGEKTENSTGNVMSDQKAAEIVAGGLGGLVTLANQFGGFALEIPEQTGQLLVSLFCPVVKKYGNKFKVDPSGVDLNGWIPEVMAIGGSALLGITVVPQLKQKPVKEVATNGDQPQHS